ncbi:hypothetical protein KX928_03530 [Roseobacter sp. YSTF-M11]|uniref:PAS fold-4 domain-containing protein n=1 Tax=Roseobacter insulae TaxID=2859783 RepID=A0A9X1FSK5_9RHOB|nr:hypothetical protein [Roseobacter insulae]MBW4706852.1 hypothetical protein [Roseobacter insulae]
MFETQSADQLAALLDHFSVPMFAAERSNGEDFFKIVCTNEAHATATGLLSTSLRDVSIRDILPEPEALNVNGKYSQCADLHSDIRYFETLTMPQGIQHWDTSIQHVPLKSGGDRIIGTAFQVTSDRYADGNQITFDNIRFFSSLADMQLQNLVSMFEAARDQGLFSDDSAGRVTRLCGICRTVQRSVEDIKEAVQTANPAKPVPKEAHLMVKSSGHGDLMQELGGSTLRALFESAQDQI